MELAQQFAALEGERLDVAVVRSTGRSRGQAQFAVKDGAVYVDGKRCREPGARLTGGQTVRVEPAAPASRKQIDGGRVATVFRDERIWVVDKPAGLPTQPPPRGGDALSLRCKAELGPKAYLGEVHRLDRDASGLLVYALDKAAAGELADQFRSHSAQRRYLAIARTARQPQEQWIDEPILELEPGRMITHATGIPARTHVVPVAWDEARGLALLDVSLQTGRTHQIRVHVALTIGPLLGDGIYGDPDGPHRGRVALHAARLTLVPPGDLAPRAFVCPPPSDFWPVAGPIGADAWQRVLS